MNHASSRQSCTLLDHAGLKHGPVAAIGRYLLFAEHYCRQRGVTLSFSDPSQLLATNEANRDTWLPLFTGVDPRFHDLSTNTICVVVKDASGKIVGTSAARRYDWPNSNLRDEAEALRFAYENPDRDRLSGEACHVTAFAAKGIEGTPVCLGGAWYHPSYRQSGLSVVLPRVSRLTAYTRWRADCIFAIMSQKLIDKGFAHRLGYRALEYGIDFVNSRAGTIHFGLMWMKPSEILADLTHQLETTVAAALPTLTTAGERSAI